MDLSDFDGTDPLVFIARALVRLTNGSAREQFLLRGEPGEYVWTLERIETLVRIRVEFNAGGEVFKPRPAFDCETGLRHLADQVVRQLAAILKKHGLEGYEAEWDAEWTDDYKGLPVDELGELEAFLANPSDPHDGGPDA